MLYRRLMHLRRFLEKNLICGAIVFIAARFVWKLMQRERNDGTSLDMSDTGSIPSSLSSNSELPMPARVAETPVVLVMPTPPTEAIAQESELPLVEIEIPDELIIELLEASDRFMCAIEMATFLAMMKVGGAQVFLSYRHNLDAAMLNSLRKLEQTCRDELEFVLLLYTIGSPSEKHAHLQVPAWASAFLAYCVQVYNIEFEREHLLSVLTKNKRELEQRMLNFNLFDRVRIVLVSHLTGKTALDETLLAAVSIKPEWQEWLQQTSHTPLELAKFISLHTRTQTGSLVENVMSWHFPMEPDHLPAMNSAWLETMSISPIPVLTASASSKIIKTYKDEYIGSEHAQIDGREVDAKVLAQFYIDDLITVEVTGVQDYGAFVETESGVKGLIHKSKVWGSPDDVTDYFNIGDIITVSVLRVDMQRCRLELSMQLPEYDPLLKYYPGGTAIGKITSFLSYGIKVEIEQGVRGLIHCNDMGCSLSNMQAIYTIGDEIEVLIIRVDMEKRHLSLADMAQ